nr:NADH-quinone oxidoreductase subunit N [candidate division Zixibacteria bacterium]
MMPDYNLRLLVPEIFLFLWALFIIAYDVGTRRRNTRLIGYLAMGGTAFTALLLYLFHGGITFNNMFQSDQLAVFFKIIFLGSAFMAIGSSFDIISEKIKNHRGEYFGLVLFSTVGMMFLASASELISLYVGLELTTIPLFVLAAFYKDDRISVEAGLKYMIIGAFSSAILLYGLSLLYGLTGTTDIIMLKINMSLVFLSAGKIGGGFILAVIMVVAGIGFKLALVPFHMWAPDVYQGAPTPITALLSVGSKAAGLVAFMRIFVNGLYGFADKVMAPLDWGIVVAVLAAAAMILGNITALRQKNIKRMLAYSSIAQIGYIMVGMVATSDLGVGSVGFYMFIYLFANMGAFAVATVFNDKTGSDSISSYGGLSKVSPALSAFMAIFMLSLAGIPPLGGFVAKYLVFAAGIQAGYTWLVILALLTSVVALYYYANVLKMMYFSSETPSIKIKPPLPASIVLIIGVAGILIFGLFPEPIMNFALEAAKVFAF